MLAFYNTARQPACALCTGHDPHYACPSCGREDNHYGKLCADCTLLERGTALLADTSGRIHPRLQPVFDAWIASDNAQTTVRWFSKPSSRTDILRYMALGELPIAHDTFGALPSTRSINYVRDLLTATGVLEPYTPLIARTTHWLRDVLKTLPKHHADHIHRFARWHLLRRLRTLEAQGKVTRGAVQNARANILTAIRLLVWLDERNLELTTATQSDLDDYLAIYPGRGSVLAPFLTWANKSQITPGLRIFSPQRSEPEVRLAEDRRWHYVDVLLHDTTIRRYTRIAGLFMLLFAQPLSRISRMRPDQVILAADGTVTVTFDTIAIEMPSPLDELLREHLAHGGPASYSNHGIWLFPGRLPGKHLVTENIRVELVAHGIQPSHARKAALFQLAAEMPTPVLAELLGISPVTAGRWAALSSQAWSRYMAMRRNETYRQ